MALYYPNVSNFFAPALHVALFFIVLFSLLPFVRFEVSELTNLHPIVLPLVFWQQILFPALVIGIGLFADVDRNLLFFTLVILTSGSLFASPTLVQMMGLDRKIAVQTVFLSTLAAPVSILVPFWFLNLGGSDINFGGYFFRVVVYLLVPVAILYLVRKFLNGSSSARFDKLDRLGRWGSVFALLVFCFALEGRVGEVLAENPEIVVRYLLLAVVVSVTTMALTMVLMWRFGDHVALTAGTISSFRNVGLTYGLVAGAADDNLAIFVGVCQIPIFFVPFIFDLFASAKSGSAVKDAPEPEGLSDGYPAVVGVVRGNVLGEGKMFSGKFNHQGANFTKNGSSNQEVYASLSTKTNSVAETMQPRSGMFVSNAAVAIEYAPGEDPDAAETPLGETARLESGVSKLGSLREEAQRTFDELTSKAAETLRARRYLVALLLLSVLGVVGVWHANKYFAPMLFDQALIEKVAETHIEGRNFGVFDLNINIRDLRNATIARMDKAPEAVVLGASHWQEAHVELVTGKDFYNSHVHRDYYEDMLAVTEMYIRHDKMPKEMIITIRDNLLTPIKDRTDFLWLPGIKYYRPMAERLGLEAQGHIETLPVQTWRELVSLPLLWTHGSRQIMAAQQPHASDERNFAGLDTLLPGGSILWSQEHKDLFTQERSRKEALAFAAARKNNPPIIDPKGVAHIEALLEFLQKEGVEITLAHPPFNPIYWDAVQGTPYMDGLNKVKALTQSWAEKYNLPMIGGFDPKSVGCTADMYIDAEHSNPKCLGMLLGQFNALANVPRLRGPLQ